MKLSVYSLKKVQFSGEASLLNCKTIMGEITVLDNHETFIGVLRAGVMRVVEKPLDTHSTSSGQAAQGKDHFFEVTSGFLEVRHNNEVRCLVD